MPARVLKAYEIEGHRVPIVIAAYCDINNPDIVKNVRITEHGEQVQSIELSAEAFSDMREAINNISPYTDLPHPDLKQLKGMLEEVLDALRTAQAPPSSDVCHEMFRVKGIQRVTNEVKEMLRKVEAKL
jgi:hypothetical protein